jgi:hypothetical protein
MVMQTRSLTKREIYGQVLENPLLLSTILSFLESSDGMSLLMTNKNFFDVERLYEVTQEYIQNKYDEYSVRKALEEQQRFGTKLCILLNAQSADTSDLRLVDDIFDYIVENKDFLMTNIETFEQIINVMERKLLYFLVNCTSYSLKALHYLGVIFDIFPIAERDPELEEDEYFDQYVIDRRGERIYF